MPIEFYRALAKEKTVKGLVEGGDSNIVYLSVKHGSIVEESKHEKPGFSPVEVTNPDTDETSIKFIKRYKTVEALVCKIEWYSREHKGKVFKGWKISLDANGTPAVLDLPDNSRAGRRFVKLAENIDYTKPVEFRAWRDRKDNKVAFYVGQNGETVKQLYTKEEPGDCPPGKQNLKGEWNFSDQEDYLFTRMTNLVIPKVVAVGNQMPTATPAEQIERVTETEDEDTSFGPFDEEEFVDDPFFGDSPTKKVDDEIEYALKVLGYSDEKFNTLIWKKYNTTGTDWRDHNPTQKDEMLAWATSAIEKRQAKGAA